MRVALDVTAAARQGGGIGRYTRELAAALLTRGGHEYVLFVADRSAPAALLPPGARTGARVVATGLPARANAFLWHRLGVPLAAERWTGPVDVLHATDFLAPPLARARAVVTVHDLSFLRHPDRADPALRRHLARAVPAAVKRAAHVLADSEHTRLDLIALVGAPPDRVTVAYPGVSPAFRRVADPGTLAAVREAYDLRRPFVLGVGTLEPRKDWPTLVAAYGRLRGAHPDLMLVIAGGAGWLGADLRAAAARQPDDLRLLGFVPDADLPALYSLAEAFAYPSVYEGFGLPALEALACGVPSVVVDSSSLPEVVGDAALRVPPRDPDALAAALARLLTDTGLREELARRGPVRAARFTWDACAAAAERAYAAAIIGR